MKDLNKKIAYISNIKTVSLILIIWCHCAFFFDNNPFFAERSDNPSMPIAYAVRILDMMLVESYVFCSGYLYGRSLLKHNRTIGQSIKERAKRLLSNYYLYGIIWLVPLYTFFDIASYGRPDHAGYLEGYRCMALGLFSDHLWFLWMLFWISVFFILVSPLIRKNRMVIVFILTVGLAVVVDMCLQSFPYFKLSQISPYLMCYLLGIMCFGQEERIDSLSKGVYSLLACICAVIIVLYVVYSPEHFIFGYIAKPAGALVEFFIFRAIDESGAWLRFTKTGVYEFFVKYRMDYYLLHMPAPFIIFRLIKDHVGSYPLLCVTINFVLTMLATTVIMLCKNKIVQGISSARVKLSGKGE